MDEKAFYQQLVQRYKDNKASDEELELFFQLLKEGKLDTYLLKDMDAESGGAPVHQVRSPAIVRILSGRRRLAAACITLLMAVALYLWIGPGRQKKEPLKPSPIAFKNDAPPGSDRAILTLADGTKITLDSTGDGKIAQQGGTKVIKLGGQLAYTASPSGEVLYNTISTPKGGQYQVVLPDGTKVWLNAVSSLRFPTTFSGSERTVELDGEAYFEVTSKATAEHAPFRVNVNNMRVEVLGTHFNVMAYQDETAMKTTLLEGRVRVTSTPGQGDDARSVVLTPGQQASVGSTARVQVQTVDVDEAVAWKNGLFQFNNASLSTVMRQAARWYDMEVVYEGNVKDESFTGTVPRMEHLSGLLKVLELTKTLKFDIQGNKIIVKGIR
jgi:ferric-dicitrate binding protein FerR (iron transport regulator)